jgi:hypothetical protein
MGWRGRWSERGGGHLRSSGVEVEVYTGRGVGSAIWRCSSDNGTTGTGTATVNTHLNWTHALEHLVYESQRYHRRPRNPQLSAVRCTRASASSTTHATVSPSTYPQRYPSRDHHLAIILHINNRIVPPNPPRLRIRQSQSSYWTSCSTWTVEFQWSNRCARK